MGGSLPTLRTTLDSDISCDACKGLTKQGTNHLHEMETASLSGLLSDTSWMFGRVVLCQQKGTAQIISPCHPMPTPNAKRKHSNVFQRSENFTRSSVSPTVISIFLGHKDACVSPPTKGWFCFSLLGYSDWLALSLEEALVS